MPRDETAIQRASQAEDDRMAYELRTAGLTYQQIADRQGVDVSTAHRRVQRALADNRRKAAETREDIRDLDLAKLAWLERQLLVDGVNGDRPAARLLLQIVHCRKRYLKDVPPREGFDAHQARSNELIENLTRNLSVPPTLAPWAYEDPAPRAAAMPQGAEPSCPVAPMT